MLRKYSQISFFFYVRENFRHGNTDRNDERIIAATLYAIRRGMLSLKPLPV